MEINYECPICFEEYTPEFKPLILPCGHSACQECLASIGQNGDINCPTCRVHHQRIDIKKLTINYALIPSSPSSKPKQQEPLKQGNSEYLQNIQKIQQQIQNANFSLKQISNEFEQAAGLNQRCREDCKQIIELLLTAFQNLNNKWNANIEEAERKNNADFTHINEQFARYLEQKNNILALYQEAYTTGKELGPSAQIAMASQFDMPEFDVNPVYYVHDEQPDMAFANVLHGLGGSIIKGNLSAPKQPDSQMSTSMGNCNLYESSNSSEDSYQGRFRGREGRGGRGDRGGRGGRGFRGDGFYRGRGRGFQNPPDFRQSEINYQNAYEERKREERYDWEQGRGEQNRYEKRIPGNADQWPKEKYNEGGRQTWSIKRRLGYSALPPWACAKIAESNAQGIRNFDIVGNDGNICWKVDLQSMTILKYNLRRSKFGKPKTLVLN